MTGKDFLEGLAQKIADSDLLDAEYGLRDLLDDAASIGMHGAGELYYREYHDNPRSPRVSGNGA